MQETDFDVKIGINPISWCNDDLPSLGGNTPLQTILTEGKTIGYRGFELGNKFPKEPEVLRAVLAQQKLELVSGWYSGKLARRTVAEEIRAAEDHVRLLAGNGAKVLVYGEVADSIQGEIDVPLYKRPRFFRDEQWREYGGKMTEFGRHLLSRGLRLAYHHHMGAYVESAQDVDRLLSCSGEEVGLLFDSGHITFAGGDAVQTLQKHVARVCHVHCKDVRAAVMRLARNRAWSFLQSVLNGVFTVPGDGAVNFSPLLEILRGHHYRGWLVVEAEQDPAVAPAYAVAEKGYRHLAGLLAQGGRMSRLLIKPRTDGKEIVSVTPESAGWRYVGFAVFRLKAGETFNIPLSGREACVVILQGIATVGAGSIMYRQIGGRQSVFSDEAPYAVYLPAGPSATVTAHSPAEIAVGTAPATGKIPPRLIEPASMRRFDRGQGLNQRSICDILPQDQPAESLLVVEVRTSAGHSSSYPPHKHDRDQPPEETQLEETYYHRVNPPQGFVFQRVYTDDRTLDESMAVEDRSVVLVPKGYHPVVVPYGYESYYLNVMAGPRRLWCFKNDPVHEWMLK